METIEFTFRAVPRRYPDLVERHAVPAVCPTQGVESRETVVARVQQLLGHWRRRVGELAEVGWPPFAGTKARLARSRALNCQPAFALTSQPTEPCRDPVACPFCHARRVRATWGRIDRAFFPAGAPEASHGGTGDRSGFDLVERKAIVTMGQAVGDEDALLRLVESKAARGPERMREWMAMPGMRGACERLHVRVTSDGHWLLQFRAICMVSPDFELPSVWVNGSRRREDGTTILLRARRKKRPSRRDVMLAVALTCEYPDFLLSGEVPAVLSYLRVREALRRGGLKVARSCGVLRKRAAWE